MGLKKKLANKFLEQYTSRLLVASYDVAKVKENLGIDEEEYNRRVLMWLRGEKE